jgi:serpin B
MTKPFEALGMVLPFQEGAADFSGMNGQKELHISAIFHKAFVAVDEEGTEAAAATAVVMSRESLRPLPPVFRADHPFIFLVRDKTNGNILFLGRLAHPKP